MAMNNNLTNRQMTDTGGTSAVKSALVKRAPVNVPTAGSASSVPALQNVKKTIQPQVQKVTKLSPARKRVVSSPSAPVSGVAKPNKPTAELTPVKPKISTQKTQDPWKTGW